MLFFLFWMGGCGGSESGVPSTPSYLVGETGYLLLFGVFLLVVGIGVALMRLRASSGSSKTTLDPAEVEALRAELAETKAQLADAEEVPAEEPDAGPTAAPEPETPPTFVEPKTCACGMSNPPEANFCRHCGEPLA